MPRTPDRTPVDANDRKAKRLAELKQTQVWLLISPAEADALEQGRVLPTVQRLIRRLKERPMR